MRAWLRTHPAGFTTQFPDRQVNSIYFDTPDLDSLQDNLDGLHARQKFRLRWYGHNLHRVSATLELKIKRGMLGWKRLYHLPEPLKLGGLSWTTLLDSIHRAVPQRWRHLCRVYGRPTILVRYERRYLASADRRLRLTLDSDLEVFDQSHGDRLNVWRRQPNSHIIVVELKCDAADREALSVAASQFPIRTARCSKYVNGVRSAIAV